MQFALTAVLVEPVKEPALFEGPPPAPVMLPPLALVCQTPKPFKHPPPPKAPGAKAEDAPCH